jgi:hypothetical protein
MFSLLRRRAQLQNFPSLARDAHLNGPATIFAIDHKFLLRPARLNHQIEWLPTKGTLN